MERNYKLYVHIAPNGKKYYGITKQKIELRWRKGGKGYYQNQYFTNAINKYGWDNIEHIVLQEELDEEEAKKLEQYMIQWYDTANRNYGYNISLGGDVSNHSEETKQKISKALKGRQVHSEQHKKELSEAMKGSKNPMYGKHLSEEARQKLREVNLGKHLSEETKRRISESCKGKKHSEEAKQKMSEALKGKYTGKNNAKARNVICITTNSIFDSLIAGAKYYNTNYTNISKCCNGKVKSAGKLPDGTKLVWKYIDIIEL
jgi:group I intron endonuclease